MSYIISLLLSLALSPCLFVSLSLVFLFLLSFSPPHCHVSPLCIKIPGTFFCPHMSCLAHMRPTQFPQESLFFKNNLQAPHLLEGGPDISRTTSSLKQPAFWTKPVFHIGCLPQSWLMHHLYTSNVSAPASSIKYHLSPSHKKKKQRLPTKNVKLQLQAPRIPISVRSKHLLDTWKAWRTLGWIGEIMHLRDSLRQIFNFATKEASTK